MNVQLIKCPLVWLPLVHLQLQGVLEPDEAKLTLMRYAIRTASTFGRFVGFDVVLLRIFQL